MQPTLSLCHIQPSAFLQVRLLPTLQLAVGAGVVGSMLGAGVGSWVGSGGEVGSAVGDGVGSFVGCWIGAGVGAKPVSNGWVSHSWVISTFRPWSHPPSETDRKAHPHQ